MLLRKFELVIFDLAGTTVRDDGEVPAAFTGALAAHGIDVSSKTLEGLRGASKRQAIATLAPAAHVDEIYANFVARLTESYGNGGAVAINDAERAFTYYRGAGVKVALNTGFDRDITDLLITELGWRDVVDAIVCGDDVAAGRPAPDLIFEAMRRTGVGDPARVVNVGDTQLDLRAAAAAEIGVSVGVLSGAHDRARLENEPHTVLLNSVADLPETLPV